MRTFFLGDEILARGGISSGGLNYAYFCPACGDIWGKVHMDASRWMAVTIPCRAHGSGSFLLPLIWWDAGNGTSLRAQLASFPADLVLFEAKSLAFQIVGNPND